jgi:hypothetical protein
MSCGAGTKLRGIERFPLAARAQNKENRIHTDSIRHARPPAAKAMRIHMFGKEPFDLRP